jgi:hypothetical protein
MCETFVCFNPRQTWAEGQEDFAPGNSFSEAMF